MYEFFFADHNLAYSSAVGIVIGLSLLEGLGLLIGVSIMSLLDQFGPFDVEFDADVSSGGVTGLLGWLCLNRLPLLIWLVLYLTCFAVSGYLCNYLLLILDIIPSSSLMSLVVAITAGILLTRLLGQQLALILPKNESSAISSDSFIGQVARITVGNARMGKPAEAVFQDQYGQKHYVMVEPVTHEDSLTQGSQVVLLEKTTKGFAAQAMPDQDS